MKFFFNTFLLCFSSLLLAQQQVESVDFKTIDARLTIFPKQDSVSGEVSYVFDVIKAVDSLYIDAQNMEISQVSVNGGAVDYFNSGTKLWCVKDFQPSKSDTLKLKYTAKPKKAMYFLGWDNEGKNQVWTQGQGKYTSNWLPSFDDMNEKTTFNLQISFPKNYTVIANGVLKNLRKTDTLNTWQYISEQPMSNYLFAIAAGKYNKKEITSKSGVPLEWYYYPEDSLKVESTYRYSKRIFDFLESEIGVAYPWKNYKQIPVSDFLYAGMENTSATIFSDAYVVDDIGFADRNYVNINAHELAHQWFGDLVTEVSGTDHWLQEGFATYYALLAERDIFGSDYYKMRLFEYAKELEAQDTKGQSTTLLNPKASSTTFYKKGAWTLHALRVEIGDAAFKTAVKNYVLAHQFKNVTTKDFITQVELVSGKQLDGFFDLWLKSETFPTDSVLSSTKDAMSYYMQHLNHMSCVAENDASFLIDPNKYYFDKQAIIKAHPELITEEVIRKNGIEVRQTIATVLTEIPVELQSAYETFLDDPSYKTQEIALYNLWSNFAVSRIFYLDKMKNRVGFSSKNIKQLWLALALSTPEYKFENNEIYINELLDYTSPKYDFEVRELAFNYVNVLKIFNETAIKNLIEATHHHNWRFKKYAKDVLETLKDDPNYKSIIQQLQLENKV